jgi:hypothetical protein
MPRAKKLLTVRPQSQHRRQETNQANTIAVMLLAAIFENGVRIFAWEIYPVFNSPYSWNRAEAGTALRW